MKQMPFREGILLHLTGYASDAVGEYSLPERVHQLLQKHRSQLLQWSFKLSERSKVLEVGNKSSLQYLMGPSIS